MVELVDTMDSKSIAFAGVAVRVRSLVPDLRNSIDLEFIVTGAGQIFADRQP